MKGKREEGEGGQNSPECSVTEAQLFKARLTRAGNGKWNVAVLKERLWLQVGVAISIDSRRLPECSLCHIYSQSALFVCDLPRRVAIQVGAAERRARLCTITGARNHRAPQTNMRRSQQAVKIICRRGLSTL